MSFRLVFAMIGAAICLAGLPAVSFAQSLPDDAYSSPGAQVLGDANSGGGNSAAPTAAAGNPGTTSSDSDSIGVLPFTGEQLAIIGLLGLLLLGSGLVLRRVSRSTDS